MTWPCYWIEDTGEAFLGLRRYTNSVKGGTFDCAGGHHNGFTWLDQRVRRPKETTDYDGFSRTHYVSADSLIGDIPNDDQRWPTVCASCDYVFTDADHFQPWAEGIFRRTDTGEELTDHPTITVPGIAQVGPGAMRDAWWHTYDLNPDKPDDGIILQVWCPYMDGRPTGQPWIVDTAATGGGYWTRTGDPRNPPSLTVTPSIAIGVNTSPGFYHGFLQAGLLTDHLG